MLRVIRIVQAASHALSSAPADGRLDKHRTHKLKQREEKKKRGKEKLPWCLLTPSELHVNQK